MVQWPTVDTGSKCYVKAEKVFTSKMCTLHTTPCASKFHLIAARLQQYSKKLRQKHCSRGSLVQTAHCCCCPCCPSMHDKRT